MNALKVLFLISFILYMLFYEITFYKHFFAIFIPYVLFTQILFYNSQFLTLKRKALISMWSYPYDPQILGTINFNLNKAKEYLAEYSKKVGCEVNITILFMKMISVLLKKFKEVNGNVVVGKVI